MLGFTLSKLNLLIFVIAVFSIVSYFLVAFENNATTKIALDLVKLQSSDAYSIITSDSLCDSKETLLPNSLSPDASARSNSYYVLKISKTETIETLEELTQTKTKIVFAVAKRKTQNELVSASSINVSGKVYLFNYQTGGVPRMVLVDETDEQNNSAIFDPQAEIRSNKIVLIKEVIAGENHTYFIPCSTENDSDNCKYFREKAMEALNDLPEFDRDTTTETGGFKC
ncbi:MAG: hypothetical protein Q7S21_02170 [archaeon]|nr:hypothetical protein [archaeon]